MRLRRFLSKYYLAYIFFLVFMGLVCLEAVLRNYYVPPYVIETKDEYALEYGFYDDSIFGEGFSLDNRKIKILFLGDSFVHPDSFTAYFADLLNRGNNKKYEIKELATPGWGTDQEYIAFKNIAKDDKPDVVVLAFCLWNDIPNNLSAFHLGVSKPYFVLNKNKLLQCGSDYMLVKDTGEEGLFTNKLYSLHCFLYKRYRTYFYLCRRFNFFAKAPLIADEVYNLNGLGEHIFPEFEDNLIPIVLENRISHFLPFIKSKNNLCTVNGNEVDMLDYGYALTFSILKEIDKEVRSYGGKFYVLLLPLANAYNWTTSNSEQIVSQPNGKDLVFDFMLHVNRMKEECLLNQIDVIDFSEKMESLYGSGEELIRSKFDIHYNEKGKEFVAKELYVYFKKFIEPSGPSSVE